jgi:hypothetical protein
MMETLFEFRPNVKRAFLLSLGKVLFIAALIIGGYYYLSRMEIFGVFKELLGDANITLPEIAWGIWVTVGVVIISIGFLGVNYFDITKRRYVGYKDNLTLYKNFMIFQLNEIKIPYWNIQNVETDDKKRHVIIEATGIKNRSITLKFIDDPEKAVEKIKESVRHFKANYYADYVKRQRIKSIAEQI